MTTPVVTLADFLLARIADDEAAARITNVGREWSTDPEGCCVLVAHDYGDAVETHFNGTAEHIARHDPARVLAECEAKRRIVNDYRAAVGLGHGSTAVAHLERCLWALAAVYADHPDYHEEWKP